MWRGRPRDRDRTQDQRYIYFVTRTHQSLSADGPPQPQSRQASALDMDIAKDTVVPVEPYIPYEPYDELNITDGESTITEQSIRVMYEDPGQRDEQHRLMSLFESGAGLKTGRGGRKGAANPGRTTRRSTRIGGL
jgi:DNA replication regulator DPB11